MAPGSHFGCRRGPFWVPPGGHFRTNSGPKKSQKDTDGITIAGPQTFAGKQMRSPSRNRKFFSRNFLRPRNRSKMASRWDAKMAGSAQPHARSACPQPNWWAPQLQSRRPGFEPRLPPSLSGDCVVAARLSVALSATEPSGGHHTPTRTAVENNENAQTTQQPHSRMRGKRWQNFQKFWYI